MPVYPSRVRVGAIDYEIKLSSRKAMAPGKNYYGFFCPEEGRIYLANDLPADETFCTLIHEIIHALNYEINCKMSEDDVERSSRVWACVLRDNPDIAKLAAGARTRKGRQK